MTPNSIGYGIQGALKMLASFQICPSYENYLKGQSSNRLTPSLSVGHNAASLAECFHWQKGRDRSSDRNLTFRVFLAGNFLKRTFLVNTPLPDSSWIILQ